MRLLAIETATEACSVALLDGDLVLARHELAPRGHAQRVLPWAEALLAEAGLSRRALDGIAVSTGPGAFTGVRLGLSLAQGIALALDRPLLGVSTLAVLALRADAGEGGQVLAAIDARMGEVYHGAFRIQDGLPRALASEQVQAPDRVELAGDGWHGVGTGLAAADGALATRLGGQMASVDAQALPAAADLLRLAVDGFRNGQGVAPEQVQPTYLRNNVALTLAEQQAARAAR